MKQEVITKSLPMKQTKFKEICPFIIWNSLYERNSGKNKHRKTNTDVQDLKQKS